MKIELKAKKMYGFSKKVAIGLINKKAEAYKHYWRWCEKQGLREGYCDKGYAKENYQREINLLETKEYQEENLQGFQRIKKALKEKRLVLNCVGGLSWSVQIIENNQLTGISVINQKTLCSYPLNYDKRAYTMACYGTSRPLEIILAYGYALGLDFNKIPQSQQID